MDEPHPPQREEPYVESERDRRIANIVLLVFLVALIGGGIWLANAMFEQRQLDDCVAQGRTNCAPRIEAPPR
jgi:cytoskeletal protein RodZ